MIVLDTSVIYALLDGRDARHREATDWYRSMDEDLVTTPLVLAECDYLAATRAGIEAVHAFRADVRAGAYLIEWWPRAAAEAAGVADRYADLGLGLTDASLIVLADRAGTTEVATFDERHFRAVRPLGGDESFRLLPLDA